jgi:hypothetical protein
MTPTKTRELDRADWIDLCQAAGALRAVADGFHPGDPRRRETLRLAETCLRVAGPHFPAER